MQNRASQINCVLLGWPSPDNVTPLQAPPHAEQEFDTDIMFYDKQYRLQFTDWTNTFEQNEHDQLAYSRSIATADLILITLDLGQQVTELEAKLDKLIAATATQKKKDSAIFIIGQTGVITRDNLVCINTQMQLLMGYGDKLLKQGISGGFFRISNDERGQANFYKLIKTIIDEKDLRNLVKDLQNGLSADIQPNHNLPLLTNQNINATIVNEPPATILPDELLARINAYLQRIEGYEGDMTKDLRIGWRFQQSQVINRKVNVELAKQIKLQIENNGNLQHIFSSQALDEQRCLAIGRVVSEKEAKAYKHRAGFFYNALGVNSKELQGIIKDAQKQAKCK